VREKVNSDYSAYLSRACKLLPFKFNFTDYEPRNSRRLWTHCADCKLLCFTSSFVPACVHSFEVRSNDQN